MSSQIDRHEMYLDRYLGDLASDEGMPEPHPHDGGAEHTAALPG